MGVMMMIMILMIMIMILILDQFGTLVVASAKKPSSGTLEHAAALEPPEQAANRAVCRCVCP